MGGLRSSAINSHADILNDIGLIGFWECDYTTGKITVEPSFARFYGVSVPTPRTLFIEEFLARVHPDDTHVAALDRLRMLGPDCIGVVEYRIIDQAGVTHWVFCRARYQVAADGQPLSGRGAVFDITASKESTGSSTHSHFKSIEPIDRIADLLLEARKLAGSVGNAELIHALSLSLFSTGRLLARPFGPLPS